MRSCALATSLNQVNSSIGQITTAGAVSNYTDASISGPIGITSGPDGAVWFTNNGTSSVGRITTAGVVSNYSHIGIGGPERITTGPDGALWFTNTFTSSIGRITTPPYVTVAPSSGPAGTVLSASGGGFSAGETVKVIYKTGLTTPPPASVLICTGTAALDGTFTCSGNVPPTATAGADGVHKIVAKGVTSCKAKTTFTLT